MKIKEIFRNIGNYFLFLISRLILMLFICGIILLAKRIPLNNNVASTDGFTIEEYNVVLDVKENNTIDVTENITVNFQELKHGIYKITPLWLKYTGKDDKTIKRKSKVLNYRAVGDSYSLDFAINKAKIKIGDAGRYVGTGNKTYVIKYTYDMGSDPFKDFDEFIFHTYGDYWKTEIKNASLQVNMPKSIDGSTINFFKDKYRQTNVNEVVDYSVVGNTLYASFNTNKDYEMQLFEYCNQASNQNEDGTCNKSKFKYNSLNSALTVDIELPEGYFVGGSWNYGYGSFIISIIIFILTGITIYFWFKFGKNYDKGIQTVEFYPPKKMSAAEVGYIYGKQTSKKLTISLIVQLASKGYIKIDEIKKNKKEIQITNLLPIKPNDFPKRVIKVKKLKELDNHLTTNESTMMKYLFKECDIKLLSANIDKFNAVKDDLVLKGYIEILSDNELEMPDLTELELIVYNKLFENNNVVILSEHYTFYEVFSKVDDKLETKYKDIIHDKDATIKMITSIFITIMVLLLSLVSYILVEDLDPNYDFLYILSFLCILVNIFLTLFMKRRTEYGEKITAQIQGFREFLITAEKEKLEALVNENPNYFYDILPYTYVLNISKKWIEKFENIPIPKLDMGNFDYSSDRAYNGLYKNVYYPESVHFSGSSGSFRSSGHSSCGGGCSSCGGGGSW